MKAGITLKLEIDSAQDIELRHQINRDGKAQKYFTHQVRRMCDKYVPFDKGPLKNTAVEDAGSITYVQPYAAKNYYSNRGNGTQGMSKQGKRNGLNVNCLRGPYWDKRMWVTHGDAIISAVATYVGGKVTK